MPNTDFGGTAPKPYDAIPVGPWYSRCMERLRYVAPGEAGIHRANVQEIGPRPTVDQRPGAMRQPGSMQQPSAMQRAGGEAAISELPPPPVTLN